MHLYTFTISHFSEKARWALDLNGVAYHEQRLLPGMHVLTIRPRAKKTSVPVLEDGGRFIQGSGAIIDYVEERLGKRRLVPASEAAKKRAAEIEAMADRAFGRGVQRIFYAELLSHRRTVVDMWNQDGPAWGRAFYAVAFGLLAASMRRMYRIDPVEVEEAKDEFRRALDLTDAALENGPFLAGDTLTRADVTVAALLAPLCRPPEHVVRWPSDGPPALEAFCREHEQRPTYRHVLRMYREHRRPVA